MVKLFDIHDGKLIPTEHCYALNFLKNIMDQYPEDYLSIYKYLFYMTCRNEELNPFFNVIEEDREELILEEIGATFSTEDDLIQEALEKCQKLYETPTLRAYNGMAKMIDRLASYMDHTPLTHGRDGNITAVLAAAKNFEQIRNSFKGVFRDLQEEQKGRNRGGTNLAYDQ